MIAFLSCLNFALPILRLCLSLPMLVRQGYSALFVSILSGESKELITMMKARGKKPQVWSPSGLYRHVIILFMTFWPCRTSSVFSLYMLYGFCRHISQTLLTCILTSSRTFTNLWCLYIRPACISPIQGRRNRSSRSGFGQTFILLRLDLIYAHVHKHVGSSS